MALGPSSLSLLSLSQRIQKVLEMEQVSKYLHESRVPKTTSLGAGV